jgi:hypothetical protein
LKTNVWLACGSDYFRKTIRATFWNLRKLLEMTRKSKTASKQN